VIWYSLSRLPILLRKKRSSNEKEIFKKTGCEKAVSVKLLAQKKELTEKAAAAAGKLLDAIKARHKSVKKAYRQAKKAAKKARRELEKSLKKSKPAKKVKKSAARKPVKKSNPPAKPKKKSAVKPKPKAKSTPVPAPVKPPEQLIEPSVLPPVI